jgi:hypothetical protein
VIVCETETLAIDDSWLRREQEGAVQGLLIAVTMLRARSTVARA